MKKSKSILHYSAIVITVTVLLTGVIFLVWNYLLLPAIEYPNRLLNQPHTKWCSEDGKITFVTDEKGVGIGTLTVHDNIIDIYFITGPYTEIQISPIIGDINDDIIEIQRIESWSGRFIKEDKFIAYVNEYTTYYEIGDKIIFYRQE